MAKGKRGQIDYIRPRAGSQYLWFRYVFPRDVQTKPRELSLKTRDMKTARERAAVHLIECVSWVEEVRARKNRALERRPVTTLDYRFDIGDHVLEDGTQVHATEETCYYVAPDGRRWHEARLVRTVTDPVGWTLREYIAAVDSGDLGDDMLLGEDCPGWRGEPIELPPHVTKPEQCRAPLDGGIKIEKTVELVKVRPCADDEHLKRWIFHRGIGGYLEREAWATWAKFRELVEGKPLKDCDREDGRKLVAYFFALGNKSQTVRKKIMPLCAAVELAIREEKLRFNPFSGIIPKINDAERRWPMPEEDLRLILAHKEKFKPEQWLLYLICATTGMRRDEAFSINRDRVEAGIRYVIIGEKTPQSMRRVPLPDAVLPCLPPQIKEPLFAPHLSDKKDRAKYIKNLGREVLRQMKRVGVETPGLHMLRHRAKDRMRAAGISHEQQEELLGHEKKTVADNYGKGYPMPHLKNWIETIGYGAEPASGEKRLALGVAKAIKSGRRAATATPHSY